MSLWPFPGSRVLAGGAAPGRKSESAVLPAFPESVQGLGNVPSGNRYATGLGKGRGAVSPDAQGRGCQVCVHHHGEQHRLVAHGHACGVRV